MNAHLTQEELILRHYGEDVGRAAAAHLETCDECRHSLAALGIELRALNDDDIPVRDEAYGARVWARVRPRLREKRALPFRRFALPAAMAASVVLAFVLGRASHVPEVAATPAPSVREAVRERILLVAVGDHLDHSRMVLIELANAADAKRPVDITSEQLRAAHLVADNRLYRQTASRAGEARVASVLGDLERLLVEIANGPTQLTAEELASIRKRLEDGGLLFKVKVLGTQVRERGREGQKSKLVS